MIYTVTGYSKTAKMVMDPHKPEKHLETDGSAGTDIKLNLDIFTDASVNGTSSSGASTSSGVGGLVKKQPSHSLTVPLVLEALSFLFPLHQLCIRISGPAWSTISCSF